MDKQQTLPTYQCIKHVQAFKILSIQLIYPEMDENTACTGCSSAILRSQAGLVAYVSSEYVNKHNPKAGGYYVKYEDGYESFSPAKAFEEGYVDFIQFSKKKKAYYAHPMNLYNTAQELRDIELLEHLGFEVVNPNDQTHRHVIEGIQRSLDKVHASVEVMEYFKRVVSSCDLVAFRSFQDMKIGAGVYTEVKEARDSGKPVIELPTLVGRALDVEDTRSYLSYIGQR